MFLKNYYKTLMLGRNYNGGLSEHTALVTSDGTKRYFKLNNNKYFNLPLFLYSTDSYSPFIGRVITTNIDANRVSNPSANTNTGVIFGDGDTPVTIDDYWISGNSIKNLGWSNTTDIEYDETGYTVTSVFTLINNNSESVTIKEIALCSIEGSSYSSPTSTSSDSLYYKFLGERTVLDTPVTIPAGGVGQVTYTVRINYPT